MQNTKHDEWVARQTRESIAIRMEAFADEFERLANTAKQAAIAESFSRSVHGVVARNPLTAADLEPLSKWLSENGDRFEEVATTSEQKNLVAAFKGFIAEIGSVAVKDALKKPLVNALLADIRWQLVEGASNGIPFLWLSPEHKKDYLAGAIDWTDYLDRGLDFEPDAAAHIDRIIENVIAGKPSEQWMGKSDWLAERLGKILDLAPEQPAKVPERKNDWGFER